MSEPFHDALRQFLTEEAAKELDRLRAENQRLREENDSLRDTEKRLMEHIDAKTGDCVQDEMWDDMWHLAHPSDGSWEYPGQVIREVSHAFSELRAKNQRLREFVRYWSYCTRMGMNQYCPEKKQEFREKLLEFGLTETGDFLRNDTRSTGGEE